MLCDEDIWLAVSTVSACLLALLYGHSDGVLGIPFLGEEVAIGNVEAVAVDSNVSTNDQVLR